MSSEVSDPGVDGRVRLFGSGFALVVPKLSERVEPSWDVVFMLATSCENPCAERCA